MRCQCGKQVIGGLTQELQPCGWKEFGELSSKVTHGNQRLFQTKHSLNSVSNRRDVPTHTNPFIAIYKFGIYSRLV